MIKVHRIILMIIDHDDLGAKGVENVIENTRYPNHCIRPEVMEIETREIEWRDDHPLNIRSTAAKAFGEMFEP